MYFLSIEASLIKDQGLTRLLDPTLQSDHGTKYSGHAKEAEDHHAKMHTGKKRGLCFRTHRVVPHDMFEHQGDDGHAAQHPHGPHGGQKTGCNTIAFRRNTAHYRGGIG